MADLLVWPEKLPASLAGLGDEVADRIGADGCSTLDSLAGPIPRDGDAAAPLLVILDSQLESADSVSEVLQGLEALAATGNLNIVFVGGDGYLSTDETDLKSATVVAAAVATIRSLAVRRGGTTRANLVCVPAGLYGAPGSQRGPIRQPVERRDVAAAAAFMLGETGSYLSGQVLFADGGRQLLSSATA